MNKIVFLASGTGRSLANLIDRIKRNALDVKIEHVIVDRQCRAMMIAENARIPVTYTPSVDFTWNVIRAFQADLVCMAGYMRLLPIAPDYENRVMNIHPSLLPSFGGKGMHGAKVHEAVYESGVKFTGCTVHFCDNLYDHGPIILQKLVPVTAKDTPTTIAEKVFALEKIALPEAIRAFFKSKLLVKDKRVEMLT